MSDTLKGRLALVTGASKGIGRAIALELARSGVNLVLAYGRDAEGAGGVKAAAEAFGVDALLIQADLADPAQLTALMDQAQLFGQVDILISNAGIARRQKLEEVTLEDWNQIMDINLRPSFFLAQRLAPAMAAQGWGRIVLISSLAAFVGGMIGAHYAASKAGQLGLMHWLSGALSSSGVTVNAVAPALIRQTGMIGADEESTLATRIPVRRLGEPEEVAQVVLGLLQNAYLTGQTIILDGGMRPS